MRKECIERQIAFYTQAGERTFDAKQGQWNGPAFPPPPELDPTEPPGREPSLAHYRGLAEFRYQIRRFVSFSERAARAAGLEPPQHQLLLAIYGLPPAKRANLPTLAERMCLDVETCSKLADELLEKGLLRWIANPTDRREKLLVVTEPARPSSATSPPSTATRSSPSAPPSSTPSAPSSPPSTRADAKRARPHPHPLPQTGEGERAAGLRPPLPAEAE